MPSYASEMQSYRIQRHQAHVTPFRRHYYANGAWHNPNTPRESRYSDFVPCNYDERNLLERLLKYARAFLVQSNGTILQRGPLSNCGGSYSPSDIEMITSSPSPTLHASTALCSSASAYNNGSFQYSSSPSTSYIKPPPPVAFPRRTSQSPNSVPKSHKRQLSTSTTSSPKVTVDAGTQYSPPAPAMPLSPDRIRSGGKRRGISESPKPSQPPPEPDLEPQMSSKPSVETSLRSQPTTASSTTLAKTSSSSSQGSSPKRARQSKPAIKYMPAQYETCDTKDLVVLISNMLLELIRFNDEIPLKDGRLTRFHSRAPPGISVKDYLQRLTTHATLSPPILLSMVYYIDKLCALYPAFTISSLTVHRFLITSATVASKGLSDSFWTNNTYARVGGVSLKELALLELEFLWRVEWRIVPKPEVLVDYYKNLVERSEGFEIEGSSTGSKASSASSIAEMSINEGVKIEKKEKEKEKERERERESGI